MKKTLSQISLFIIAMSFILVSCEGSFYEKHQKINSDRLLWEAKDVKKFTVDVKDNQTKYQLSLAVRYASGVRRTQRTVYPIKLTTTSPSGKKTVKNYTMPLKDANGEFLGDAAGDMIDLVTLVEKDYVFAETGSYTFEMIHNSPPPNTSIVGVLDVGLKIDQIKVEKK